MIPQTTSRLSLFQIEAELLGLIDQREDALERMAAMSPDELTASPEIGEEIATINGLIKDYIGREIRKVDGIAFAIKEHEARAVARAKAAEELKASAERDADTAQRIKDMVLEVMQEFGEKKLPGRLFTITRQGNGGVQPLTIAQPDLVPRSCKKVIVHIPLTVWEYLLETVSGMGVSCEVKVVYPDADLIRSALIAGTGVMGARLEPRGEHIRIK